MWNNIMYLLVPKTLWNSKVPVHTFDYNTNTGTDDEPDIVSYTPTFYEVSEQFTHINGDTILSNNWNDDQASDADKYAILKGEFTMVTMNKNGDIIYDIPGELTQLLQAGVIPLTHEQILRVIEKWNQINDNGEL